MKIELKRVAYSLRGTFGVMLVDGLPFCVTLEDPDNNNAMGISCIPKGIYEVEPWNSDKYPNTYHVKDVPGRTAILMHSGNTVNDTMGCILLGTFYSTFNGLPSIAGSKDALNTFRSKMGREKFTLTIKD